MTYVYLAQTHHGDDHERETLGVYEDLETAWEAGLQKIAATSASGVVVSRLALGESNGGEWVRWHDWDYAKRAVVVCGADAHGA